MSDLKRDLFGKPEVSGDVFGVGNYVTIDGKKYQIIRRSGNNNRSRKLREIEHQICGALSAGISTPSTGCHSV